MRIAGAPAAADCSAMRLLRPEPVAKESLVEEDRDLEDLFVIGSRGGDDFVARTDLAQAL